MIAVGVFVVAILLLALLGWAVGPNASTSNDPYNAYDPYDFSAFDVSTSRPLVGEDMVVLFTASGIVALDPETQAELWWHGDCPSGEPADPTQLVIRDTLVIRCGPELIAFATSDGRVRWNAPIPATIDRIRVSNTVVAVVTTSRLEVFDALTGVKRWHRANTDKVLPLAVDDRLVYSGEGRDLQALDQGTGAPLWKVPIYTGWLHIDADGLFVRTSGHQMMGIDPATGATRWQTTGDDPRLARSVVIGVTAHRIVVRNESGDVHVFDTVGGKEAWTSLSVSSRKPQVVTTDGLVVISLDGETKVVNASDGHLITKDNTGDALVGAGAGRLVIAYDDELVISDLP